MPMYHDNPRRAAPSKINPGNATVSDKMAAARAMLAALKEMLAPYGDLPLDFFQEGKSRDGIRDARAAIAQAEAAGIGEK